MSPNNPIGLRLLLQPLANRWPVRPYAFVAGGGLAAQLSLPCFAQEHVLLATAVLCFLTLFALLCADLEIRSRKLAQQADDLQKVTDAFPNSEARFRDFALTASDWFW